MDKSNPEIWEKFWADIKKSGKLLWGKEGTANGYIMITQTTREGNLKKVNYENNNRTIPNI